MSKKNKNKSLDVNKDGVIDEKDVALITEAIEKKSEEVVKKENVVKIGDNLELKQSVIINRRG